MKKDIIDNSMLRLSFDVTRRCNLNCKYCFKGDSQNKDITKEIVDKTIKEMKGVYIAQIRFFGGEPFLNPEMIEYIIDKLIQEHILFTSINVFTNGTIRSERIVNAFNKALRYFDEIAEEVEATQNALKPYIQFGSDALTESAQEMVSGKAIQMLISGSDNANSNLDDVQKTVDYYNSKITGSFVALNPYDEVTYNVIAVEGNAEKNVTQIVDAPVSFQYYRKIINQYCIMQNWEDEPQKRYIDKALSISVDGNVYVGCSMPYERIEHEYIFNINDCNNDFFDRVDEWCYKHNISSKANRMREVYQLLSLFKEKNIPMKNVSETDYTSMSKLNEIITAQETIGAKLHKDYPFLLHTELEIMAIAYTCLIMIEKGMLDMDSIKLYLYESTYMDARTILSVNEEYFRGLIEFFKNKNKQKEDSNDK